MLTYILFIFEGSILTIFNSYMLLNVIIKKLNRQQYKSFISCFAFDILFGLTYISIGTYRIIIIRSNEGITLYYLNLYSAFRTIN